MERGVAEFHIILPRGINSILNKSPYQIIVLLYAYPIIRLVMSFFLFFPLFLRKIPLVSHLHSDWSFEVWIWKVKGLRSTPKILYESFYGQKCKSCCQWTKLHKWYSTRVEYHDRYSMGNHLISKFILADRYIITVFISAERYIIIPNI